MSTVVLEMSAVGGVCPGEGSLVFILNDLFPTDTLPPSEITVGAVPHPLLVLFPYRTGF
jgi:hypothetical protein